MRPFLAVAVVVAGILAVPAAAAPPPNDDFGSSIVLTAASGSLTATSEEATVQPDEPFHAGEPGGASVWYSLVVPAQGEYTIETCGSAIDTLLAVYRGDSFATLSSEGSSDDACGAGSRVVLDRMLTGTVLRIAVDDADGFGGEFVLAWTYTDHSPANTSPPTIAGSPVEGQTLTAQPGTWTARRTPTYSYVWERCISGSCGFAGQAQTLVLKPTDVGYTFHVKVTARTFDGMRTVTSAPTPRIAALPPRNTSPPEIVGTARVGQEMSVSSPGGWDGVDYLLRYTWQRCTPDLATCTDIPGATEELLRLTAAQLGAVVRVVVTAASPGGSVSAASAPSAPVRAALPKPCVVPRLRGKTLVAARKALVRAGCSLGKVRRTRSSVPRGRVAAQSSKPGKRLRARARVGLIVSLGRNS